MAVGDGRQGAGAQALHFQGQPVAAAVVLLHHRDLRHTVSGQPIIHRADELIGVGLFAARVGKQDQVNGDAMPVKSNKDGGAVRAAAKDTILIDLPPIFHRFFSPNSSIRNLG